MIPLGFRRFRINGRLTVQTPLHVGDGRDRLLEDQNEPDPENPQVAPRVATVARDFRSRPCLPGSSLKGCVRSEAKKSGLDTETIEELFGTEEKDREQGGKLTFCDAYLKEDLLKDETVRRDLAGFLSTASEPMLHWNPDEFTYVMASTALDRVTGAVQRHKLYHFEAVPPGAVFNVAICGEGVTDENLAALLKLLEAFNEQHPLHIGALSASDFGNLSWQTAQVAALRTREDAKKWLSGGSVGLDGFPEISETELKNLKNNCQWVPMRTTPLAIRVRIHFEGPFLINDPTRSVKRRTASDVAVSHAFLKAPDGKVLLPAKSVRGALRAQAERIVRTVQGGSKAKPMACRIDDPNHACPPVTRMDEVFGLCLTCRLFGGNGWRSPVEITDFTLVEEGSKPCKVSQDFVAVDRFTGGAASGKKFAAAYFYQPVFEGEIRLDLSRIPHGPPIHLEKKNGTGEPDSPPNNLWRIGREHAGLLALTLRDLIEGDISFGFGKSKGFGSCRAEITKIEPPDSWPDWIERDYISQPLSELADGFGEGRAFVLRLLVESFVKAVRSSTNPEDHR